MITIRYAAASELAIIIIVSVSAELIMQREITTHHLTAASCEHNSTWPCSIVQVTRKGRHY